MDVAVWLRGLGLEQYETLFRKNDIDAEVLSDLTDGDLEKIGVSPLNVRVGIATGLVVVGDLIGSGEAQERGIVGETPNLAARLQGIAEPNAVVIAESTRRLLGNLFELEDLGARDLKGIARPSRAWTALRPSSVESRFEALHATGLTALVGREEEFELLLRRWSRAKTGEGQVVLLCGEAGIGKSRLTAALLERLTSNPHTRLRYFCSPHHTDSALYPIIGQMERAAGLAHDDSLQTRLDKLDAVLGQVSTSNEDAALIAEMLSLPNDGRYPALELAPQERRQRTLEALISQLEALTRRNPVLMIFEDAHWIDPTSLEVLGRAVNRIATIRVLLIVTFRPEFDPPWIGQPHVTALTINRLAQREVADMIDRVVGNKLLPASTRQDIVERTDGIPLFVEETTKAVLEAESEGAARRTVAAIPPPDLAVPASLHASLMARLDRLGAAKEVAQIGAAIGREFSHALLAAVAPNAAEDLGSALNRLIRAGLLFRQGVPPHATYLFKHALVRDAAYSTLLREPRRALHAHIAAALESRIRRDCREPAGDPGPSLHRGRADRKGGGLVGKGGTAVAGALGASRGGCPADKGVGPTCEPAGNDGNSARETETAGVAGERPDAREGLFLSGCDRRFREGTINDRECGIPGRTSRGSPSALLDLVRPLGGELHRDRCRSTLPAGGRVSGARRKGGNISAAANRPPFDGRHAACAGPL